jgi:hypothetical protein
MLVICSKESAMPAQSKFGIGVLYHARDNVAVFLAHDSEV